MSLHYKLINAASERRCINAAAAAGKVQFAQLVGTGLCPALCVSPFSNPSPLELIKAHTRNCNPSWAQIPSQHSAAAAALVAWCKASQNCIIMAVGVCRAKIRSLARSPARPSCLWIPDTHYSREWSLFLNTVELALVYTYEVYCHQRGPLKLKCGGGDSSSQSGWRCTRTCSSLINLLPLNAHFPRECCSRASSQRPSRDRPS